jgi:hypothetical protein
MPLDFNPIEESGRGKCNPKNRASVPQGQGGMGSDRKSRQGPWPRIRPECRSRRWKKNRIKARRSVLTNQQIYALVIPKGGYHESDKLL